MRIFIHSSGRAGQTLTDKSIPSATMLVQAHEYELYKQAYPKLEVIALPPEITTLSPTRQWIIDNCDSSKVMMVDDDLRFCTRRSDDPTKFVPSDPEDVDEMLNSIQTMLSTYAHVGVLAREGANRILEPELVESTRMMRLLAYHVPTVQNVGAKFDRLPTKQDFDMTLQLLRAGYPNAVLTSWCHDQPGSNTKGGCSKYRTSEMMEKSANDLAALHPGLVRVVQKETKGAWGGGTRTDVVISWKKALCYEDT